MMKNVICINVFKVVIINVVGVNMEDMTVCNVEVIDDNMEVLVVNSSGNFILNYSPFLAPLLDQTPIVTESIMPGGFSFLEIADEELVASPEAIISGLLNLGGESLKNQILSYKNDNLKYILQDGRIRDLLLKEENHYAFVWVIQGLDGEDLLHLCDDSLISKLVQDKKFSGKLNALMTCGNDHVNQFMKNQELIASFIDDDELISFVDCLNLEFGLSLYDYIHNNCKDKVSKIGYLNKTVQQELLRNKEIMGQLLNEYNSDILEQFVCRCDAGALAMLLEHTKFQKIFSDLNLNSIVSQVKKGLVLPIQNGDFVAKIEEAYLRRLDINEYRQDNENLKLNNPIVAEEIERKRKKQYEQVVFSDEFESMPESRQLEMTVDCFYETITVDFLKALRTMTNFVSFNQLGILSDDKLKIYSKFLNYSELSVEEKQNFFALLKQKGDLISEFYDDYRSCLDYSYSDINKNMIKLDDRPELFSPELTEKTGVTVYELNGEDFYSLITVTGKSRESCDNDLVSSNKHLLSTSSLSLIGSEHVGTFGNPEETIVYGFENIDTDRIMHLYESDSFSSRTNGSDRIPKMRKADELLKDTHGFNELLYLNQTVEGGFEPLRPSYIVSFNDIKNGEIETSRKHGIPIVLLHSECYSINDGSIKRDDSDRLYGSFATSYLEEDYHKKI